MAICASVLQRLATTTTTTTSTMLTKVGQLCCEGGCTGRGVAARGGEAESDDSPRESRADPMKRHDYFHSSRLYSRRGSGNDSFPLVIALESTRSRTGKYSDMEIIASHLYSSRLSFASIIRSMGLCESSCGVGDFNFNEISTRASDRFDTQFLRSI